jgi:hypothetical protein
VPDVIQVILTDYGRFGWGISSPQLPELVGGGDTYEALYGDLDELLAFGGAPAGSGRAIHIQKHCVLADGDELLIRIARDAHETRRTQVGQQLTEAMKVPAQLEHMLKGARRPTGELLFICALADDTLAWVSEQLTAEDAACAVISLDEQFIRTQYIGSSREQDERPWRRTADMGFSDKSTLGEMVRAQDEGLVQEGQLLYA